MGNGGEDAMLTQDSLNSSKPSLDSLAMWRDGSTARANPEAADQRRPVQRAGVAISWELGSSGGHYEVFFIALRWGVWYAGLGGGGEGYVSKFVCVFVAAVIKHSYSLGDFDDTGSAKCYPQWIVHAGRGGQASWVEEEGAF